MKKNIIIKISCLTAFATLMCACSLKYNTYKSEESSEPELIFTDVDFDRYEDGKKNLELGAKKLEQYKDGNNIYAKDMSFRMLDKDGAVTTQGKCGLLGADTDKKKYMLSDNIEVEHTEDDLIMSAKNLKWDGVSEQLTSGRNDMVTIKKGNTNISGSGFSASGVSKKFSFTGVITGETNTKDSDNDSEEKDEAASSTDKADVAE